MHKHLFQRIVNDVTEACPYFQQRANARGTLCFIPLQKYTTALRQLAYATSPNALDENLKMFGRTAQQNLYKFCKYIIRLYGP